MGRRKALVNDHVLLYILAPDIQSLNLRAQPITDDGTVIGVPYTITVSARLSCIQAYESLLPSARISSPFLCVAVKAYASAGIVYH